VTTDACRDWRGALGAAALGGIEPAEEIALRAHLDGCPACRAELHDLTAVARALDSVPMENVISAPAEPSRALGDRVFERVAHERDVERVRRHRRLMIGAGAFVSAAAAVIAVVLFIGGGGPSPGTKVVLKGVAAPASATLRARAVGTEVDLKVAGLDRGHYYWLWLTGDNGHRIAAGTFSGTGGSTEVRLMDALPLSEARRIWVTDDKRKVVLDAKLSSG
jgi:anti-sigma factor RsiW